MQKKMERKAAFDELDREISIHRKSSIALAKKIVATKRSHAKQYEDLCRWLDLEERRLENESRQPAAKPEADKKKLAMEVVE